MGHPPDLESESGTEFEFVEENIVIPSRLGAYIATVVTFLRCNKTDKFCGRLQELHLDTFLSIFLKSFDQIESTIGMFTQIWCSAERSLSVLSISNGLQVSEAVRLDTVEINMPSI